MPQHHRKKKQHSKKHHHDKNNNHSSGNATDSSSIGDESQFEEDDKNSSNNNDSISAYAIKYSEIMGRYLVAARDLNGGDMIIQDPPIIIGPCADSEYICLGCYIPLPSRSKQFKCLGCGWHLCNSKCKGIKTKFGHSPEECSILRENRVADHFDKSDGKTIKAMYECIVPLRCLLLKQNDKDRWSKLMGMESHNEIRKKLKSLWDRNQEVIVNRIRNSWGIKIYTEEEIHTICGVLEVNCFEVGQNGARARALYPSAFLLAHDCCPNTTHADKLLSYDMTIRASRKILKGEAITLSYAYTLQGTLKRREHLHEGKFFWCTCGRCRDPTEFGTYTSALQCPKCLGGLILSTNPLEQSASWKCKSCEYTVTGKSMLLLMDRMFNELDAIDPQDIKGFEEFLEKYRNVLHKNHYLCLSAKYSLCQLYGRSEDHLIQDLTSEELRRKEDYCRDILKVVDKLDPGLSRLRGVIMYELHAPIMIQATRLFETKAIACDDLKKRLKEVVRLLRYSEEILLLEPDGSSEHSMGLAAKDALQRIGKV